VYYGELFITIKACLLIRVLNSIPKNDNKYVQPICMDLKVLSQVLK
jgi:hypothetical protein